MVKTARFGFSLCETANPHDCAECFQEIAPTEFFLRESFIKSHFEKVDSFIAPSEFLRQRYIAWGIPSWQIITLENGMPLVRPPPPRPLAKGEGRSVFAFFGQITPFKGLVELLAAFDHLARFPAAMTERIRLFVHGGYPERSHPQFVEGVRKLFAKVAGRVHFAGSYRQGDLYRLMAGIDWVVVPSVWWENSPLVIEEALAHRRPVICSAIGGMAEKVRPGQDGLHFPVGNPFELANLIVRVAAEETVWERLQGTMRRPLGIGETVARHLEAYRDRSFALAR